VSRLEDLQERRWAKPPVAIARRFFTVQGLDLGALIALELFTTVMPLVLIGYARAKRFSADVFVGSLFADMVGADGRAAARIHREFGRASGIEQVWNPIGLASFLVWGIPMSLTVGRMFAGAWQRPQYSALQRIWRGGAWFLLYLLTAFVNEELLLISHSALAQPPLFLGAIIVSTCFWGLTPTILVPGVRPSWRLLIDAGLPGAIVNVLVLRGAVRIVFPLLLSGWDGFGPVGVALTIMTWCGSLGVVWVVVACAGAVITERAWVRSA
jgi:hypothetical protein